MLSVQKGESTADEGKEERGGGASVNVMNERRRNRQKPRIMRGKEGMIGAISVDRGKEKFRFMFLFLFLDFSVRSNFLFVVHQLFFLFLPPTVCACPAGRVGGRTRGSGAENG